MVILTHKVDNDFTSRNSNIKCYWKPDIMNKFVNQSLLHNHELIQTLTAIMRVRLKIERGKISSPTRIWSMVPLNQKPVCYQWATLTPNYFGCFVKMLLLDFQYWAAWLDRYQAWFTFMVRVLFQKITFLFQFQDILRPNYNSVDLTEVELTDSADSEARGNDTELLFVSI